MQYLCIYIVAKATFWGGTMGCPVKSRAIIVFMGLQSVKIGCFRGQIRGHTEKGEKRKST